MVYSRKFEELRRVLNAKSWFGFNNVNPFFTSAPAGLVILDPGLRILKANDTMAEMIGGSVAEILGRTPAEVTPLLAPLVEPILRQVSTTGQPALNVPLSGETPKLPGVVRHWIASIFPMKQHNNGKSTIGAIAVEVTDQVQFDRVAKSQALLAQAEETANLGSWEHDCLTGEEVWSANLCRMFGREPTIARIPGEVFWESLHPQDRAMVSCLIEWGMKDRRPYEYQARFILPDGKEHVLFTRGKVAVDSSNHVIKRYGVTQDITARVEIERELLKSEERYRDLVENSRDLICTHALDGTLLSMNERPAQLLGFRPEDLLGKRIPDLLPPKHRAKFTDYLARIQKYGHADGLMVVATRTGEERIWEYQNTLRTEGVPSPIIRGAARDVTDRVKAERAVRESESKLRALVNSIDELVFEFDAEGRHLDLWSKNDELLIWPRDQILGRTISELMGEQFARPFLEVFRRVLNTGKGENLEFSVLIRGEKKWFLGRATPIFNPSASPQTLCFLARDITERKRAEDSLRLFRGLIDQTNDAIEVLDPASLRFLDVNDRACRIFGYSREELLSMSAYDVDVNARVLQERINQGLGESGELLVESVKKRKDGRLFPVEVGLRSIELDRKYYVAVVRDITQRKLAENALRRQEATVRNLFQLTKTLTGTLHLQTILDFLNFQSMRIVGATSGCAGLRTDRGFSCDSFFLGPASQKMGLQWPPGGGILARVLEGRKTYVTNDAVNDPLVSSEMLLALGLRNILCVPVLDVHSEVIAFFALHNKETGDFLPADIEIAEGIAQVASIAIQNALAYRRIQQAEEALRRLSTRLINTQDEERRRIARELHEATAQDLAALRMSLGRLERSAPRLSNPAREALGESLHLSDQAISEIRTLSYLLHPPILEEAGLRSAVKWYALGFSKRSGIGVNVEIPENLGRLPRDHETTLFRILQECLTNIHSHSGGHQVQIRMIRESGHVSMEVQDDGKGMASLQNRDPSPDVEWGVGIPGMRERVRQFHGTFELISAPGRGTTVRVLLPLSSA
jgi:PAS domain S-box-containing protein